MAWRDGFVFKTREPINSRHRLCNQRPDPIAAPVDEASRPVGEIAGDSLYHATALGRSTDGRTAADHDRLLYAR